MIRNLLLGALILSLFLGGLGYPQAFACAGYTLSIGREGSHRQEVVSQIMAELIRQRTGTKIRLVRFSSQEEMLAEAERQCFGCDVNAGSGKQPIC